MKVAVCDWLRKCEHWLHAKPLCKQGAMRWYELRATGVTASEIATVVGLNPFEQPMELFRKKRERYLVVTDKTRKRKDIVVEEDEPLHLRLGRALESLVVDEFEKRYGQVIHRGGYLFRHKTLKHLLATPDAIVGPGTLLECKTCARWAEQKWGDEGTDHIPPAYMCQVQYQMGVMGADSCWVAVFFRHSDEFQFYKIDRNQVLIARLFAAANQFWEQVRSGNAPAIDWTHRTTPEVVKDLSVKTTQGMTVLARGWDREWDEYQALGELESALKKRREFLRLRVMHAIGEHGGGVLPDGRTLVKKVVERAGYEVAASSYVTLKEAKTAIECPVIGEVPYVAIDDKKQPARIGFTEPDRVGQLSEAVRDGASEAPDSGAVHANRPDVPDQNAEAGGMHTSLGDAVPVEPVADGTGAGRAECSPDPV